MPSSPAPHIEETRARIIKTASEAFRLRGIKGVTMDDVSHLLGMSKRTLYQVFRDKEELLLACLKSHEEEAQRRLERSAEEAKSVLDIVLTVFRMKMEETGKLKFGTFSEIFKYPRAEAYLRQERKRKERMAVDFLRRGIDEGFFLPTVDFSIVYANLMEGMEALMRNPDLHDRSDRDIFVNTAVLTIRGCATPRGIALIDQLMEQYPRE